MYTLNDFFKPYKGKKTHKKVIFLLIGPLRGGWDKYGFITISMSFLRSSLAQLNVQSMKLTTRYIRDRH